MDTTTARILCDINTEFYRHNAVSFSATRVSPWHGWKECARMFNEHVLSHTKSPSKASVFDLACGNLRFEEYLCEQFPQTAFSFFAVDNCEPLLPTCPHNARKGFLLKRSCHTLHFQNLDIAHVLLNEQARLDTSLQTGLCDLSVTFGFMHHMPTQALRLAALQTLITKTHSKGLIAVSFWQFLNNENLAKKALRTHEQALDFFNASDTWNFDSAQLEEGDFFLGWRETPNQYRYCHSFSESEIAELACAVAQEAEVLSCFVADGRTNNLNSYLVLQKR